MSDPAIVRASIGNIGNTYGNLEIAVEDGQFFWGIEDCSGIYWEQIPEWLYQALIRYEQERRK